MSIAVYHFKLTQEFRTHMELGDKQANDLYFALSFKADPSAVAEVVRGAHPGLYFEKVAEVHTNDKSVAFEKTNHISFSWTVNPEVTVEGEASRQRSTSVGDIMVHEGQVFLVAPIGFQEIPVRPDELQRPQASTGDPQEHSAQRPRGA